MTAERERSRDSVTHPRGLLPIVSAIDRHFGEFPIEVLQQAG
jgi:hypothetical protein